MQVELLLGACLCMFVDWVFGALRFHIFILKVKPDIRFLGQSSGKLSDALCFLYYTVPDRRSRTSLYLRASRRTVVRINNIKHHLFSLHSNHAHFLRRWYRMVRSPFFTERGYVGEPIQLFDVRLGIYRVLLLLFKPELVFRFFHWLCNVAQRRFTRLTPILERATSKVEELVIEHKSFAVMFLRSHK